MVILEMSTNKDSEFWKEWKAYGHKSNNERISKYLWMLLVHKSTCAEWKGTEILNFPVTIFSQKEPRWVVPFLKYGFIVL
jgi:hypothetical protein